MTVPPVAINVYIERGASAEEVRYIQTLLESTSGISEVRFVSSEQFREYAIKAIAWIEKNFKIRRHPPKSPPAIPEDGDNGLDRFHCPVEDYFAALRVMKLISPDIPGIANVSISRARYPYNWDDL